MHKKISDAETVWDKFVRFINSLDHDEQFTRKQMLDTIYHNHYNKYTTADHYRLFSVKTGFIKRINYGLFQKNHDIPKNLRMTQMYNYSTMFSNWKSWFMPDEKRLEWILKDIGNE